MIPGSESINSISLNKLTIIRGLFVVLALALSACENDLREVEKVSNQKQSAQIDKSTGVTIIYSDSARVKAQVTAPLLIHHKTKDPYYEMPKGATVIFYDENNKESSRVVSDFALQYEKSRVVEMRKNVVATSVNGNVFKSDELIWDPKRPQPIYSTKLVTITQPNGNVMYGNGMSTDEKFEYWELPGGTGIFSSGPDLMQ